VVDEWENTRWPAEGGPSVVLWVWLGGRKAGEGTGALGTGTPCRLGGD